LDNSKKILILIGKVVFLTFAVIYIYHSIDLALLKKSLKNIDIWLIITAFIAINISKLLSIIRISLFYDAIDIRLKGFGALCLYYLGMFYNTLLPGGIGGDGYKIYRLHKNTRVQISKLTSATLLDRVSGVGAIVFLLFAIGIFHFLERGELYEKILYSLLALAAITLIWKYFLYRFFPTYRKIGFGSIYWASWVQIFELASILFIALSIGIDGEYRVIASLFFISSLLSVIPISIGGLGIREIVFMSGFGYIGLNEELGVMVGFIFFMLTLISSALGGVCLYKKS